ncbi:MAG: efflux RND transporter periplasmic adaptor subunit [Vicinamibacterales bacterium]
MTPSRTRQNTFVTGTAAALLAGGMLAGCSTRRVEAARAAAAESVAVTVAAAAMADVATAIDSGGVVQARTTATIAARIVAPVRDVRVSPGDRVRAGQTLIVLDGDDLAAGARAALAAARAAEQGAAGAAADLQAAEAGLTLAHASYDRVAALQAKRSATAQELDDATALLRSATARVAAAAARAAQAASAVESARAAGDQSSTTAAFTTIPAPFDGVVTATMVEAGNMASPGQPLLRLEDTREFRLEVRVDESRIDRLNPGDGVPVFLGARTSPVQGTVAEVSRAVDADARAFLVKIALPDLPGLRSGEFGKARFAGAPRRALTVPASAVVRSGQLTSVFVADDGVARLRFVHLSGNEVLAGLTESETVILSPPAGLTDGRLVSPGGR